MSYISRPVIAWMCRRTLGKCGSIRGRLVKKCVSALRLKIGPPPFSSEPKKILVRHHTHNPSNIFYSAMEAAIKKSLVLVVGTEVSVLFSGIDCPYPLPLHRYCRAPGILCHSSVSPYVPLSPDATSCRLEARTNTSRLLFQQPKPLDEGMP